MKSFVLSLVAASLTLMAHDARAEVITAIKAAELACHRIDRLVVLKKIDKNYLSKFQKLELVELPANDASGGKFAATSFQTAPHHGAALSISILLDQNGKVLKHQVNEAGNAGPDVAWSGKDPVSLAEAGLHHVLDEHLKNDQLRPFAVDFHSLTLTQKSLNGKVGAELRITARTTTAKLILNLDLNGKLLSKEVIP
jgi:hypothetical protein